MGPALNRLVEGPAVRSGVSQRRHAGEVTQESIKRDLIAHAKPPLMEPGARALPNPFSGRFSKTRSPSITLAILSEDALGLDAGSRAPMAQGVSVSAVATSTRRRVASGKSEPPATGLSDL